VFVVTGALPGSQHKQGACPQECMYSRMCCCQQAGHMWLGCSVWLMSSSCQYMYCCSHCMCLLPSCMLPQLAKLKHLKQQQQSKAASAAVSAEPSQGDLLPELSAASSRSSPASLGAAAATKVYSSSQSHQIRAAGAVAAGASTLPVIAEAKPQLAELMKRRQQQLQALQQQRASNHNS